ncbi:enoyl-CoA hydratase/isomerase family protein [Aestuariirhabdus sp. Z084]|uniref:enoyl-CoA hydratase/isomerase family protein n=1 Tax=Aestuariirhabdus haliotis TaxID=2918751 RepID=UPI00201B3B55|nr:enoyl-CoA hydratase/isomerase family protein [Aestuariirhabdus haliotis]MCL6417225.1 enoyl-CoA hydratase/isomerase family protein [Aestuariirhabdus haliotis]MCL6421210.1 enoyl-CoA hydratase/isomerase family protein [Aestuariirhabdus haliotis]
MKATVDAPVLFETRAAGEYQIGFATLNVEKALNALSLDMIDLLYEQLLAWQQDDRVVCVMLQGAGEKAFCAGGDIRRLYDSMCESGEGVNSYAVDFFSREYRLDYLIHCYGKPLICWGAGIVMGGGVGLMSGASHRVVTETTRLAMPEINIGLYPDVGGSWFLARMPGRLGKFLGLTAASLNAADTLFTGLADRFLRNDERSELCDALCVEEWTPDSEQNKEQVTQLLRRFEKSSIQGLPVSPLRQHYDLINRLMDHSYLQQCLDDCLKLETEDRWLQRCVKAFANGCPISAHLVVEQIEKCRHLSLKEVFQQELIVSVQCAAKGEFREGVRALLIDKDNAPQWAPKSLDDVVHSTIAEFYQAPWGESPHPLADL